MAELGSEFFIMAFWTALLTLMGLTFFPGMELRASIPFGFFSAGIRNQLPLPAIVAICFAANVCVGMLTFWLMRPVELMLRRWGWFDRRKFWITNALGVLTACVGQEMKA